MSNSPQDGTGQLTDLRGMYEDYFLDYASYVILERAVPAIEDGLKPVQRRILHAMREMHDGRFHKVANIIGQTMQYHPHGDAAIGDALVKMGQKELLIETQGNWGDERTGDSAAAPRYIEAKLSDFAVEVAFNPQTTEWQLSYDGRKNEPITLPMKFPLLLAVGVEGIAVGLSTRIMPHNFVELLEACMKHLKGKSFKLYPDFLSGGLIDVSEYNGGKRGGKIKVRARIERRDKKTLAITELPYATTTEQLIDSILKANDKGKINIKKVTDNTAKEVEILVHLTSGVSPEVTMDALYAFTNCEISVSPNACVIVDDKPQFMNVEDILAIATERTKNLLQQELQIKYGELKNKWHFLSLEKIFIEKRVYRDIEECETWEAVLETIDEGMHRYVSTPSRPSEQGEEKLELTRDLTEKDLVRLTEIKIKRISKYNTFKAEEKITNVEREIDEIQHHLDHLTEYAIDYFQHLMDTYSEGKERRTEITSFEDISRRQVAASNVKLYVQRKEGFVGTDLKKAELVRECSDLDDIIAFRKDGKFQISQIDDKVYMGKEIIHVDVWDRGDERTTYNMLYVDGKSGVTRAKRFHVSAATRDRVYDLTKGTDGSKVHYFSAQPNGEAELVNIKLSPNCRARKKELQYDFADLDIKGRRAQGNIVTKYPIRRVHLEEVGKSTLGAQEIWMDEVSGRLNKEARGKYLGAFDTGDHIIALFQDGSYMMTNFELPKRFKVKELLYIGKYNPDIPISAVYYEGDKKWTLVKRFNIETSTLDEKFEYITDHRSSELLFVSVHPEPKIKYKEKQGGEWHELRLDEFIDVKGWRAQGNKVSEYKIKQIKDISKDPEQEKENRDSSDSSEKQSEQENPHKVGDTVEFDVDEDQDNDNGQGELFEED